MILARLPRLSCCTVGMIFAGFFGPCALGTTFALGAGAGDGRAGPSGNLPAGAGWPAAGL